MKAAIREYDIVSYLPKKAGNAALRLASFGVDEIALYSQDVRCAEEKIKKEKRSCSEGEFVFSTCCRVPFKEVSKDNRVVNDAPRNINTH